MSDRAMAAELQMTQRQREFLTDFLSEEEDAPWVIGYGGARGGGKTYAMAGGFTLASLKYPGINSIIFRKGKKEGFLNYKTEIERILNKLGIPFEASYSIADHWFRFRNGSLLLLGHYSRPNDYQTYMGLQFARIGYEELTQHGEEMFDQTSASCRSTNPKCPTRRAASCNPGGPGHSWVKERFVDDATRWPGYKWIKSTIFDCPATLENTPNYVRDVLDPLPEWQRRQWRDGDWDAISGQFFEVPPDLIREVQVPHWAEWYGGVDWGRAKPFALVLAAKWREYPMNTMTGKFTEVDRIHVVAEAYQKNLDLDQQAHAATILTEKYVPIGKKVVWYADPSTGREIEGVSTEAGRTIAMTWAQHGLFTVPARTNARVPGWQLYKLLMRHRIMTFAPGCVALLNEMAQAQAAGAPGPPISEDLHQSPWVADHALDALRYMLVSVFQLNYAPPRLDVYKQLHIESGAVAAGNRPEDYGE